jgi:TRAP-type mannitol/chloroaromatic compound transport system permease large subunit
VSAAAGQALTALVGACGAGLIVGRVCAAAGTLKAAPATDQLAVAAVQAGAKKNALSTAAIFPAIMLVCYLALILHFKSRGGYRSEELAKV